MTWKELSYAGRYARVLEVYKFLKSMGTTAPSSKMVTGVIRSTGGNDPTIGGIARLVRIVRVMDEAEDRLVDVTSMIDRGALHQPIATAVAPSADFAKNDELIQPVIVMVTGVPVTIISVGTPVTTARRAYRRHFMAAMRRQKQGVG